MPAMPILETERLYIRPFVLDDLSGVHQLLDIDLVAPELRADKMESLAERARWLQWTVLNYEQLDKLYQPPYGDRAIILKSTGELIGACGFVPSFNAFEQLPGFVSCDSPPLEGSYSPEFGLYYAIAPAHQRQGYATEAVQALIDYAFRQLSLKRIVATTTYDNESSMGVMRKLGMQIEKNPQPEPPWLQVVGFLENK